MKKFKAFNSWAMGSDHRKGATLIVVIMVLAFLLSIGIVLLTVTASGPQVAGNLRWHEQAFNAAEAGFDTSWIAIEGFFTETWTNFDGHYLIEPAGIDLPLDQNYFRKFNDIELLNLLGDFNAGTPTYDNIIFYKQRVVPSDSRLTYTVFLIDDEAGVPSTDPKDALLVCIGAVQMGDNIITSRLEIELAIEQPGTT